MANHLEVTHAGYISAAPPAKRVASDERRHITVGLTIRGVGVAHIYLHSATGASGGADFPVVRASGDEAVDCATAAHRVVPVANPVPNVDHAHALLRQHINLQPRVSHIIIPPSSMTDPRGFPVGAHPQPIDAALAGHVCGRRRAHRGQPVGGVQLRLHKHVNAVLLSRIAHNSDEDRGTGPAQLPHLQLPRAHFSRRGAAGRLRRLELP
mmetsp:Transcript_50939/g.111436  ORF Transcript_50939/g.111436 Transcript_50939/m.111436 type:complete len:210 (+) Transcript_50939:1455-2084(+)